MILPADRLRLPILEAVTTLRRLSRRSFIRDLGMGTIALAVLGPIACSDSGAQTAPTSPPSTSGGIEPPTTSAPTTASTIASTTATTDPPTSTVWERVNLGNVSAYILAHKGRATIVDTGNPGSEGDIATALGSISLGWDAVDHVIATHLHGDHVGSFATVMAAATGAAGYAGEADLPAISSPRPLKAVGDGDEVAGFQIIETPGHTAGHIAVFDPIGGVLVAGDALNTSTGQVAGSDARYTADGVAADQSVQKMALLDFDVLLVGHGDPVLSGAADLVAALAAGI